MLLGRNDWIMYLALVRTLQVKTVSDIELYVKNTEKIKGKNEMHARSWNTLE